MAVAVGRYRLLPPLRRRPRTKCSIGLPHLAGDFGTSISRGILLGFGDSREGVDIYAIMD
ncbi:hypothetical protein [Mesorhizobium sp. M00.F.Ca.ET.217.01.1.1]|uniref:hypothetical protein n=1 Tax=Mesorhizobium sp. M00.F.Ca.ET.217.01.1.1 TaxID=2500529 RepID=UPI000FDC74D9|nr:hypothetical protein [Mesorhizobium sp. M00.F.Ca.ET.217.01.1.1]TGQ12705.1 hypothetical protein EN860_031940 [Mesorhizobium sp. M00.F.Ca.ET.217.01.1.1]TGV84071.1 hypothetical protein EN801_031560 [Mesorhizobium sp. M00.F.Ca.ET.158.01.1.1]TIU86440.1 MAG: hypothetical protein E5W06_09600 [Mesorhizobium sp.]